MHWTSLRAAGMLLIATDEAGYGPKLGPLVIAATAWRLPTGDEACDSIEAPFEGLRRPVTIDEMTVAVNDSKVVYKPGQGLCKLHAIVSASHHWCDLSDNTVSESLDHVATEDVAAIAESPWLQSLSTHPFLARDLTKEARGVWGSSGLSQIDTSARIITAAEFNRICDEGLNKATLLSEATVGMVKDLLKKHGNEAPAVSVFCDRHGGRRYYAGVLQHAFPEFMVQIISESARQSVYRIKARTGGGDEQSITVHFTVKGDSFAPVSFSSLHAKYLRQRFMESLNRYFVDLHKGQVPLKPTEGYPVDADRFIDQIQPTIRSQGIALDRLVRSR